MRRMGRMRHMGQKNLPQSEKTRNLSTNNQQPNSFISGILLQNTLSEVGILLQNAIKIVGILLQVACQEKKMIVQVDLSGL